MTILSVCQLVASKIGLNVPNQVFSGTSREQIELQGVANEMAMRIANDYDWQILKYIHTLTGDGIATSFSLPPDYDRMLKKARLWPSESPSTPMAHIMDSDEWLGLDVQEFDTIVGRWTIYGQQIHINPVMAIASTAKFFYISNLIVSPSAGANKIKFDQDDDSFVLDEKALELGMIWQWKANKGLPYAEDFVNYEIHMAKKIGNDKGPRQITVGQPRQSYNNIAFPEALG